MHKDFRLDELVVRVSGHSVRNRRSHAGEGFGMLPESGQWILSKRSLGTLTFHGSVLRVQDVHCGQKDVRKDLADLHSQPKNDIYNFFFVTWTLTSKSRINLWKMWGYVCT